MKQIKFLVLSFLMLSLSRCENSAQRQVPSTGEKIAALEKKLFGQEDQYNMNDAKELMMLYIGFADSVPSDEKSPDYLFKAADISLYQQSGDKTIALFDRILTDYPQHPHAAMSLFLKAFVFDNRMADTAMAHRYYSEFIQSYPQHEFADDAAIAIQNLGKSPEELIREFEKMNQ